MNETLADFISRRLSEIAEIETPLRAQLEKLSGERAQLVRAAQAAGVSVSGAEAAQTADSGRRAPRRVAAGSIKAAVLATLKETGRGMQTQEILKSINEKLGTNYPRSSLSPQLSRLKADHQITHDGTSWALLDLFG